MLAGTNVHSQMAICSLRRSPENSIISELCNPLRNQRSSQLQNLELVRKRPRAMLSDDDERPHRPPSLLEQMDGELFVSANSALRKSAQTP